jgi:acyl dehydratase
VSAGPNDLRVGERRSLVVVDDLRRTRLVQYAGASGDYNPIHTDEIFATQVAGMDSVIAHGMLTMGLSGRVVTDWVGVEALRELGVRFAGEVRPGDTLTATATVTAVDDDEVAFGIETVDQTGRTVLTGTARAGR